MLRYYAIFSARFRLLLQYRMAALAGFGTQLFFGLIRVMVFDAFYASAGRSGGGGAAGTALPMTHEQVTTYVWLGQAFLILLPWSIDQDVRAMVKSGAVAYELTRPMDLYWTWYARGIALRIAPVLLRCLPMFLVAGLFFGLQPPASWASAAAWFLATLAAVLLASAITTLVQISLLWTIAGEGAMAMLAGITLFFSGMVIPIPLFPTWMQWFIDVLPFRGVMDLPFRLYSANIPPAGLAWVLAHQLAWTAALILLGRALLARGLKRLVVQGG